MTHPFDTQHEVFLFESTAIVMLYFLLHKVCQQRIISAHHIFSSSSDRVYWSYMRQLWDLPPGDGMEDKGQGQGQVQYKGRTSGPHPPSPPPTHHEQCLASDRLKEESLVEMIRLRKGEVFIAFSLHILLLWHTLSHVFSHLAYILTVACTLYHPTL